MSLHEKWENIDHRFRMLDAADQDGEAGLWTSFFRWECLQC